MPIDDENIPIHIEAYYEEVASQEQKYLDETEEELRAPARNGSSVLTENRGDRGLIQTDTTYVIQTSDGPENAMFCAS